MSSMPTGPTQVAKTGRLILQVDVFSTAYLFTLRGNVCSLDAPRASQLFQLALEGRVLHREGRERSQKFAKIGEATGMPSLQTGPTQVTKNLNVGSVEVFRASPLFTFTARGQGLRKISKK